VSDLTEVLDSIYSAPEHEKVAGLPRYLKTLADDMLKAKSPGARAMRDSNMSAHFDGYGSGQYRRGTSWDDPNGAHFGHSTKYRVRAHVSGKDASKSLKGDRKAAIQHAEEGAMNRAASREEADQFAGNLANRVGTKYL
jgi:hypothetical protein